MSKVEVSINITSRKHVINALEAAFKSSYSHDGGDVSAFEALDFVGPFVFKVENVTNMVKRTYPGGAHHIKLDAVIEGTIVEALNDAANDFVTPYSSLLTYIEYERATALIVGYNKETNTSEAWYYIDGEFEDKLENYGRFDTKQVLRNIRYINKAYDVTK